ncbi:MAG: AMP-binding protein, partial [Oscillospiraceae bacterium]|nr:AMP-binding protein [Oscillospiraceae bacterium]
MDMNTFYQRFVDVSFDKNGVLKTFEPNYPANFNFGYDVVDAIATAEPNRRAMIWCDSDGNEREFTYGEMKYYSDKTANMFLRHGIKKGDAVMLVLRRHYEFWFSIVALHKIGAIVVPASFLLTKKDYVYRFESADIKAVVCSSVGEIAEQVELACKEYTKLQCKFLVNKGEGEREGWFDFTREMEDSDDKLERVPTLAADPMLMYFSSGTTGYPKMVLHDYTYPIGHIITAKFWHNVDPDGIHLTYSDTGWGKSVWGKLYGQWTCGTTVFVYDHTKFAPSDLLHMIEKYRITTFCAPPTIYRFFIKEGMENYDLSSLKYATTAGEALNPEVFNRFKDYTGLSLMEGFGQTESTLLTANLVGTTPKPGSMGKPTPL